MPLSVTHPFSGAESQTCSYTANFISSHADKAKALGMTEAQYENHIVQGHWGVLQGKMKTNNLNVGDILFRLKNKGTKDEFVASWADNFKIQMHNKTANLKGLISPEDFENAWLKHPAYEVRIPGTPGPAVSGVSKAVGALTDQDAATLFVKVKDDFAKLKGISVKGANAALDFEVYASIGSKVGYTATELAAKVERFKADGHKLSALKKKVLKDDALVEKAWAKKKAGLPDPPPTPPIKAANVEATKQTAADALADLKAKDEAKSLVYTNEEVSKAYIKAKDELAASVDNPWTLYTQKSKAFEDAIANLMEKSYGIELNPTRIKQQIASYLGEGNKLSVLKKKMAKSGEHQPLAPTLKKTKAEKLAGTPTTTSASKMKAQVDDFAHYGYQPNTARPKVPEMSGSGANTLFNELKNTVAAYKDPAANFESFLKGVKKLEDMGYEGYSTLDAIRAYDIKKSLELGVQNSFFYEKKLAEWASSPTGKAYILEKKTTEEMLANLPPLPKSSSGYPTNTSIEEARRIQRDMGSWSSAEKSALNTYTGGSYHDMNQELRNGVQGGRRASTNRSAQAGMRATTEKMLVHRGTSWSQFGMNSVEDAMKLIGKTVTDKGFLSTSVGGSAAFSGQVLLEVEVSPGTFAAFVKDISQHPYENEMLIAHGTHYQVLSVTPPSYTYAPTTIRVRTIPGSHKK